MKGKIVTKGKLVMRKRYLFVDEIPGEDELGNDIVGEEYRALIRTCCTYGAFMSLLYYAPNPRVAALLAPFEVERQSYFKAFPPEDYLREQKYALRFYRICPELCETILSISDHIFEWFHIESDLPDDPVFYREDGSVFFYCEIHEGYLKLFPTESEDVSNIISNPAWKCYNDV